MKKQADFKRLTFPQVIQRLKEMPVVLLIGPRQVGKTTLAQGISQTLKKEALYLDLESPDDLNKLSNPESYFRSRTDKLIIIDEVQRMPELFPLLRSVVDRKRIPGRFLLLGSASPELLLRSSESLAGRLAFIEIHPFVYPEVSSVYSFETLWLRGGFPSLLMADSDTISYRNKMDFIQTYLERELPLLGLFASPTLLRNMLRMVAHVHGQIINYSDFSRSLGIDLNTVKRYLDFFEHSYIIRRLQPYFLNSAKRLVKSPKVYFRDTGLYHAINGIVTMDDLEGFVHKGNSWEGFVIQEILAQLSPDVSPYFYRTQDGAEMDLVLLKGNKPVLAIEVKYSNSPRLNKGITTAIQDLGNIPLLYVTPSVNEDYELAKHKTVTAFDRVRAHLIKRKLVAV